jgi:NAD(P)H-hydrate epimerase
MRVLTSQEILQAEREAMSRPGGSSEVLMQAAGYAVAQFCLAHFKFSSVAVVCGRGKAGGQGLVAAESFQQMGNNVFTVVLAKSADELEPDTAVMCSRLSTEPIWICAETDFENTGVCKAFQAELIIDAIAGAEKLMPGVVERKAIDAINEAFGTVVSVGVPSGIDPDDKSPAHHTAQNAVFAHGVITFVAPRPAHVFGELTAGPIAVSEIGVQPALVANQTSVQVITGQEVGIAFPPRSKDAHKGDFGHVLVIAGSLGKAGAAAMAGLAALRTGAGLVTVACPKSIQASVTGFAPELMTEWLAENNDGCIARAAERKIQQLIAGKDAVVLGPGLSQDSETQELVRRVAAACPLPLVLDADGLNAFVGHYEELKRSSNEAPFRVLTPHPGEAARLLDFATKDIQANRLEIARRIAHETGSCVALKGWRTIVAGLSGETWINMSGNPALAKGGSGDVLSGIIAAALARQPIGASSAQAPAAPEIQWETSWMHEIYGTDSMEKLRERTLQQLRQNALQSSAFLKDIGVAAAVHLHGVAGDIARDELHENTVLAIDVMVSLAEAFHQFELQMERGLFYLQR